MVDVGQDSRVFVPCGAAESPSRIRAHEDAQASASRGRETKKPSRVFPPWRKSDKKCKLIRAAREGNENRVYKLCKSRYNINQQDTNGVTAVIAATIGGHKACVELLCVNHADLNLPDGTGKTAIHYCAIYNFLEITTVLIRYEVDFDRQDEDGMTSLHYAFLWRSFELTKILIRKGASLKVKNKSGQIPEEAASVIKDPEIIHLLQQRKQSTPRNSQKSKSPQNNSLLEGFSLSGYDIPTWDQTKNDNDDGYITPDDSDMETYENGNSAPAAEAAAAKTFSTPVATPAMISKLSEHLLQMLQAKKSRAAQHQAKPEILPSNTDQPQTLQKPETAIPSSQDKQPTSEQTQAVAFKSEQKISSAKRMCQEVEKKPPALPPPRVQSKILESSTNVASTSTSEPDCPYEQPDLYIDRKKLELAANLPLQEEGLYIPYEVMELVNNILDCSSSESDTAEIISQIFNSLTAETELETQASEITPIETSPNLVYNNENVSQTTSPQSTASDKSLTDEIPERPAPRLPKRRRNTSSDSHEDPTTGVYNNEKPQIQPPEVNHESPSSMPLQHEKATSTETMPRYSREKQQQSNERSTAPFPQIHNHLFPKSRQTPTAEKTVDALASFDEQGANSNKTETDASLLNHGQFLESMDCRQSATEQQEMQTIRNSVLRRPDKSEAASQDSTLSQSGCPLQRSSEPITRPIPRPRQNIRPASDPEQLDRVSKTAPIGNTEFRQLLADFKKHLLEMILERNNPHDIDASDDDQEQNPNPGIHIYVDNAQVVTFNSQVKVRQDSNNNNVGGDDEAGYSTIKDDI